VSPWPERPADDCPFVKRISWSGRSPLHRTLPRYNGAVTEAASTPVAARLPELLFVAGALSQYAGAAIAVTLFDDLAPESVAWLRVVGAAAVLLLVPPASTRARVTGWNRRSLALLAAFGGVTALMNIAFYLAIDRIDLGKAVAIEFVGPIAVAAVLTRSRRNALALALAAGGVLLLSQVQTDVAGLLFVLAASAAWAGYIVLGGHVARLHRGLDGLAVGLGLGALLLAPAGAARSGPAWTDGRLLAACVAVGVLSTVVPYGIDQHVLRWIPTRRFAVLLALLPVTATVLGLTLGQVPSVPELAGIGLVLGGVAAQERGR
jgi:inner membrane transporter RhtA